MLREMFCMKTTLLYAFVCSHIFCLSVLPHFGLNECIIMDALQEKSVQCICADIKIQSTLVISTLLISNNRLSRSENLVPVLSQ